MTATNPRYFLSHSMSDGPAIETVCEQAKALGVDLYLAEHDPRPGIILADKVIGEVKQCDAMVVLLTKNGADSGYVQNEVGAARAAGKLVVPLVQKGVTIGGMLGGMEYVPVDFTDPASAATAIADSLRSVVNRQLDAERERAQALLLVGGLVLLILLANSK